MNSSGCRRFEALDTPQEPQYWPPPDDDSNRCWMPDAPRFPLLNRRDLRGIRPAEWLLYNLLRRRTVAVLHARPAATKSFVALALAGVVAHGQEWLGEAVPPEGAIYMACESIESAALRSEAWLRFHNKPVDVDRFKVIDGRHFDLTDAAVVGDVINTIRAQSGAEGHKVGLVVIDPLADAIGERAESPKAIRAACAQAGRIANALDCAVLLIHHDTKTGEVERCRSQLRGAIDTMLHCFRSPDGFTFLAIDQKQRSGPDDLIFRFRQHAVVLGQDARGRPIDSLVLTFDGQVARDSVIDDRTGRTSAT